MHISSVVACRISSGSRVTISISSMLVRRVGVASGKGTGRALGFEGRQEGVEECSFGMAGSGGCRDDLLLRRLSDRGRRKLPIEARRLRRRAAEIISTREWSATRIRALFALRILARSSPFFMVSTSASSVISSGMTSSGIAFAGRGFSDKRGGGDKGNTEGEDVVGVFGAGGDGVGERGGMFMTVTGGDRGRETIWALLITPASSSKSIS